jgi:hypothetical protein
MERCASTPRTPDRPKTHSRTACTACSRRTALAHRQSGGPPSLSQYVPRVAAITSGDIPIPKANQALATARTAWTPCSSRRHHSPHAARPHRLRTRNRCARVSVASSPRAQFSTVLNALPCPASTARRSSLARMTFSISAPVLSDMRCAYRLTTALGPRMAGHRQPSSSMSTEALISPPNQARQGACRRFPSHARVPN